MRNIMDSVPVFVSADMRGITTLGYNTRVRPYCSVGIKLLTTVGLIIVLALSTIETRVALSTDSDPLALLD
jgi:hypothetical protein